MENRKKEAVHRRPLKVSRSCPTCRTDFSFRMNGMDTIILHIP